MSSTSVATAPSTTPDDPLDASVAPGPETKRGRPAWVGIAGAMLFPLFFVVMFSLCYVSAFHAPHPQAAPLYIVGPTEQTSAVMTAIEQQAPDAFDLTATTSVDAAHDAVQNRDAIGAIVLGMPVQAYVASGDSPITTTTVTQIAAKIQAQEQAALSAQSAPGSSTQPTASSGPQITDLAPVATGDPTGTGLFYFLIVCTIGGYLTVTILAQAGSGLRLRGRYLTVAIASVLAPVITFAVSSIFTGSYGQSVGETFGLLGIGAFYTFTVGVIALVANQIAGRYAIFLVMTLAIFVNFPSAGGAIPASFLPGFWQAVHTFWFGSGAMEAIRGLIYFHGAGVWASLGRTAIWLVAALIVSALLSARTRTPRQVLEVPSPGGRRSRRAALSAH